MHFELNIFILVNKKNLLKSKTQQIKIHLRG